MRRLRETRHGRAPRFRARKRPRPSKIRAGRLSRPADLSDSRAGKCPGRSAGARATTPVLGAPGGARAAHIMQFRPVGVECPGEELAPEGADFGEGPDRPSRLRVGEEREPDVMVAMTRPAFFRRLLSRGALFGALTASFGRELLKEGFNCLIWSTWYHPVISVVNGWKTSGARLPFGRPRRYISGSKFP